ncbi:hypothetical protein HA402_000401 [Bradysia odoriphaga]|nr:hypothetical protein HA402_000401 [Bradysia odoriphaga]
MGKKSQKKDNKKENSKQLPVLKRVELNQLLDNLLKLGFSTTNSLTEQWNEFVEMKTLISQIQVIESELKVKNSGKTRLACIEKFVEWAKTNGAEFDGIDIAEFPNYELGLAATKDFKQNDLLITIPRKMIMSLDNVSASVLPMMSSPIIESMSNVKFAFWLIVEKLNPDSFWKPYLDILPDKYSTVMNFSVAEMQELKGSSALPAALNQCKNIARQYAYINKFVKNRQVDAVDPVFEMLRERFTYDLYCWAVSTVMTRQNSIPKVSPDNNTEVEAQPTPALIPLWDMANHTEGVVSSSFNEETDRIESAAFMDFRKGEQIFIYYGSRNNTNFLIHNGFVYPNNLTDSVAIRLGLSDADPLLIKRTQLLDALKIPKNCELDVLPSPKYISPKLLGFVRVFNMGEEQLDHWLASERSDDLLWTDCALETALETKIWTFLKIRLTILLKSFTTTIAEDEAIVDAHKKGQNKLGHNKILVIQFRLTEKRILQDALEYVEQRTKP